MALAIDFTPAINEQSKIIEERYYKDLVHEAYGISMAEVYVQQVPNVRSESSQMSNRMAKLKKAGLIGCLNDTGITSSNYKKNIYESIDSVSASL